MGQKVNPHGLRVGVIKDWDSRWYARNEKVGDLLVEDKKILDCLKNGGRGGVAGCANVYPRTMASIYDCFAAGDLEKAQEYQASIASFRACFKYGNPNTVVKTAVALLGYDVGKCRAPFNQLPEEGVAALRQVLRENAEKGMH